VPAPYSSSVKIVQTDGSTLQLNEDGCVGMLTSPPTSNYTAVEYIYSSSFSLVDLSFETADQNLTSFKGNAEGQVEVQAADGEGAASQPLPKFFVIKDDGSALELFNNGAMTDYPERAEKLGARWHTSVAPVAGLDDTKSVTWLQEHDEENAYRAAYAETHVLPPVLNRGLEPYAVAQNKRRNPSVVCRQVVHHPKMDAATRATLLDNIKSFRHWQATRIEAKKALQPNDPRSDAEKDVAARACAELVAEGQVGDDLAIAKSNTIMLGDYETITAPPPKKQPPSLRPNVTMFDDYFQGTPFQGIMSTLEMQLYREHVPKYWDSEEYFNRKAEAEVEAAAAADEEAAAAEAEAEAAEGDTDVMKACKAFFKAQTHIMEHQHGLHEDVMGEMRGIMASACAAELEMKINVGSDHELVAAGDFNAVMGAVIPTWAGFVNTRNEVQSFAQLADAVVEVTQVVDQHLPDGAGIPIHGTVNVGMICTHTLTYDGDGKISGWDQDYDGLLLANARRAAAAAAATVTAAADEADVLSPLAAAEAKATQPKLVATRPMLKSFRPLPPIQPAATTLHASPAELVFNFEDVETPAMQVIKLNNFGASTVRLRISDVPAGIAVEQVLSPIAAGLSLEVSVEVDPKVFADGSQLSQKVRIMTTAGTVTIPITLAYPVPVVAVAEAASTEEAAPAE